MNIPYEGKVKITQKFTRGKHDGLDLVGIDSKQVRSTVNGTVEYAGWQNPDDHSEGFGYYVCIRFVTGSKYRYAYFGHLDKAYVKTGDKVSITQTIGVEGSTGNSTGPHLHYEVRDGFFKGANVVDINEFSRIPNVENAIYDDGWRATNSEMKETANHLIYLNNCKITIDLSKNKIDISW